MNQHKLILYLKLHSTFTAFTFTTYVPVSRLMQDELGGRTQLLRKADCWLKTDTQKRHGVQLKVNAKVNIGSFLSEAFT